MATPYRTIIHQIQELRADRPVAELIDTCEWMVEETQEDYRGVAIPIDKKGASYMYTINPREPVFYPQDIANAAIIFSVAEENWTITSVCSVGLDMVAIPGDTSEEILAALIADEMAIGVINKKTTATRLIPIPGKEVGDRAHFGGLLGQSIIIAVNNAQGANRFIRLGGRIPLRYKVLQINFA